MKKYFLSAFALFALLTIISCGEKSEQTNNTEWLDAPANTVAEKKEPQTVTPLKIGVSTPKEEKTPAPQCDGGECYHYDFTIGFQVADEPNTLQVDYRARAFSLEKGGTKSAPEILDAKNAYSILSKAKPEDLEVTLEAGKITKVLLKEKWEEGNKFAPSQILWQKTNFN